MSEELIVKSEELIVKSEKLIILFVLGLLWSCKPQERIVTRVERQVDSTAVVALRSQLEEKSRQVAHYELRITNLMRENWALSEKSKIHEILYSGKTENGVQLKQSEKITTNELELRKEMESMQDLVAQKNETIDRLSSENLQLQSKVHLQQQEVEKINKKTASASWWLRVKGYVYGFLVGAIVGATLTILLRRKIAVLLKLIKLI